jgi:hypothetical protein
MNQKNKSTTMMCLDTMKGYTLATNAIQDHSFISPTQLFEDNRIELTNNIWFDYETFLSGVFKALKENHERV